MLAGSPTTAIQQMRKRPVGQSTFNFYFLISVVNAGFSLIAFKIFSTTPAKVRNTKLFLYMFLIVTVPFLCYALICAAELKNNTPALYYITLGVFQFYALFSLFEMLHFAHQRGLPIVTYFTTFVNSIGYLVSAIPVSILSFIIYAAL